MTPTQRTSLAIRYCALAALVALAPARVTADAPNASTAALGTQAPAFTVHTLDGRTLSSRAFAGKVLVLNFWATWCPPCRAETADLVAAYKRLHAPDVAFLGVDTTETAPVVRTFVAARGVPYATGLAGPQTYNGYGIAYIPTTVVVDATGVVRARWTGGVSPQQLAQFVDGARKGQSIEFVSDGQKHLDAMLDPAQYTFTGDAAVVRAAAAAAQQQVHGADAYANSLQSTNGIGFDDERTTHEEGVLLEAAGNGLRAIATTDADKVSADSLLANAYGDLNRYADAAQAYRDALQVQPADPTLTMALSRAYYRLHDYDDMAATARDYIALRPNDADGYDELGLAFQRARRYSDAVAPYEKAVALLIASERAQTPQKRGDAAAIVADESLDLGDVYVSLGDRANAKRTFDRAERYAALISPTSEYKGLRDRVPDRAAEGMAAIGLARGAGTTLALSRWTGTDLPGSLKSTFKYRLIVVAPSRTNVTLTAQGVRTGWVASFCADGLCSPRTVSFTSPPAGVKTYEFQLVPPSAGAVPGKVSVAAGSERAPLP